MLDVSYLIKIAKDLTSDTNTGIFFPSADTIAFTEGGTEAMRITSDGDVGISTSNPSKKLEVYASSGNLEILSVVRNDTSGSGVASIGFNVSSAISSEETSTKAGIGLQRSNPFGGGGLCFYNNNSGSAGDFTTADERMRIDVNGNLNIGTTSTLGKTTIIWDNTAQQGIVLKPTTATYIASPVQFLHSTGSQVGTISQTSTNVAYNTSSDYRLKENVTYDFDATTRLKQLKPARFNFIIEPDKTVDGFLAHEVQDIIPEAISGEKDAVQVWREGEELPEGVSVGDNKLDENGNTIPVYQGIDQAKLTPILTKALQEAIIKIEQLEARLTALES